MVSTSNMVEKEKEIKSSGPTNDNFVEGQFNHYKKNKFRDNMLWEAFQKSFLNFTVEDFEQVNSNKRYALKDFLRENEVYVTNKKGYKVAQAFYDTDHEENQSTWSTEEINELLLKGKTLNSYLAQTNRIYDDIHPLPKKENSLLSKSSPHDSLIASRDKLPPRRSPNTNPVETHTSNFRNQRLSALSTLPRHTGRELADISRSYVYKIKYEGGKHRFDHKLEIFYDQCRRFNLEQERWIVTLPIMLKDDALDYYYDYIQPILTSTTSFDEVTSMIRDYFEGPEYRRGVQ
ncbi:hypothetical protein GcM1_154009 [Golovinomyces cichoracearum]|uniref:Integrase and RNaseH domain-containing protein n=1 Tax=Golovinomyces cichoracearum TaxID=62708 RepID=A0A420JAJ5_9PEZI|nr:hypothetical protein GcM1_154009 [Golovinomyces cichoracearum]